MLSKPEDRWDEAMRLRDQLKFEFFFPDRASYRAELGAELKRLHPSWETVADGRAVLERCPRAGGAPGAAVLPGRAARGGRAARRAPPGPAGRGTGFLDECGGVGQQMLLQGRLHGPESLSRELFASALKLAANQDLIGPGGEELARGGGPSPRGCATWWAG